MSVTFSVKVVPSSGKNGWVLDKNGILKCYLKSPPEKNLANFELITTLAKTLGIPKADISIITGLTSRKKIIQIDLDCTYEGLLRLLGLEERQEVLPLT